MEHRARLKARFFGESASSSAMCCAGGGSPGLSIQVSVRRGTRTCSMLMGSYNHRGVHCCRIGIYRHIPLEGLTVGPKKVSTDDCAASTATDVPAEDTHTASSSSGLPGTLYVERRYNLL